MLRSFSVPVGRVCTVPHLLQGNGTQRGLGEEQKLLPPGMDEEGQGGLCAVPKRSPLGGMAALAMLLPAGQMRLNLSVKR